MCKRWLLEGRPSAGGTFGRVEVFTEKEEQAQQLTGRCPSLLEATIEELIILLEAEPIGRRKSKSWQESSVMPLCIAHITTAYSAFIAAEFEKVRNLAAENMQMAQAADEVRNETSTTSSSTSSMRSLISRCSPISSPASSLSRASSLVITFFSV